MLTLVIGGARSGKSKWALRYGEALSDYGSFYYVATAIPFDEEMKERIERHKRERSAKWRLIEEPIELPHLLNKMNDRNAVILIDCLTIWLSNLIYYKKQIEVYRELLIREFIRFRNHKGSWLIVVTNEVGLGVVPETEIGRFFRDESGVLNQKIAEIADEVYLIIAGLPLLLKGKTGAPHYI